MQAISTSSYDCIIRSRVGSMDELTTRQYKADEDVLGERVP